MAAVIARGFKDNRKFTLHDMAFATGAIAFVKKEDIDRRAEQIRDQIDNTTSLHF